MQAIDFTFALLTAVSLIVLIVMHMSERKRKQKH